MASLVFTKRSCTCTSNLEQASLIIGKPFGTGNTHNSITHRLQLSVIRTCEFKPRPPPKSNDLRFQIRILNANNYYYETVTRTGRDVVNAVLKLLSWIARVGVPVQTSGRPSSVESAKGGLIIIGDPEELWGHKVVCLVCVRVHARIVVSESESTP